MNRAYCQYVEHLKLSPCQCIFPYICFIFKFVDFDIFTIFVQPELLYRVLGLNSFLIWIQISKLFSINFAVLKIFSDVTETWKYYRTCLYCQLLNMFQTFYFYTTILSSFSTPFLSSPLPPLNLLPIKHIRISKVIVQGKLFQKLRLCCTAVYSLRVVMYRRMSKPHIGSIFHKKKSMKLLWIIKTIKV